MMIVEEDDFNRGVDNDIPGNGWTEYLMGEVFYFIDDDSLVTQWYIDHTVSGVSTGPILATHRAVRDQNCLLRDMHTFNYAFQGRHHYPDSIYDPGVGFCASYFDNENYVVILNSTGGFSHTSGTWRIYEVVNGGAWSLIGSPTGDTTSGNAYKSIKVIDGLLYFKDAALDSATAWQGPYTLSGPRGTKAGFFGLNGIGSKKWGWDAWKAYKYPSGVLSADTWVANNPGKSVRPRWSFFTGSGADCEHQLAPTGVNMSFDINDPHSVSFTLNGDDDATNEIIDFEHDLKVRRNGVPMFRGRITPGSETIQNNAHTIQYSVANYKARLRSRLFFDGDTLGWSAEILSHIVGSMVGTIQNRDGGDEGIAFGTGASSQETRDYEIQPGSNFTQAMDQLGDYSLGFDWEIDPNMILTIYNPYRRKVNNFVRLAYGANITSLNRSFVFDEYGNVVMTSGTGILVPEVLETATFGAAGRWEIVRGWPDVEKQEVLQDRTSFLLETAETRQYEYNAQLAKGFWQGPHHLWIGDIVTLEVHKGRISTTQELHVTRLEISIEPGGVENVTLTMKGVPA